MVESGVPATKLIRLIKAWDYPFRELQPTDRVVVLTDDAMDPLVWQSAMAALVQRGVDPLLCLQPKRAYHNADPVRSAISAAGEADVILGLTTTALNSGTPAFREQWGDRGSAPLWLMEEITAEILTDGGGRATAADIEEICDLHARIGDIYDRAKRIRVSSKGGTEYVGDLGGMEPGHYQKRWARAPFSRNSDGKLTNGTWPYGEVHVEPVPGSSNGTVVWDVTAHHPEGEWKESVAITIKDGWVTAIDGGHEAEQVRWYLETYGDKNAWQVGGEIAIGTNKLCPPHTGSMRSEKKRWGAMHFGIGHGPDRKQVTSILRFEGIVDNPTVVVDDDIVICENGRILV